MTAFSIMAHALHRELAARGVDISVDECEDILRRVVDHAGAVASSKLRPIGDGEHRKPV